MNYLMHSKKYMTERFKKWCRGERHNRVEIDTSQDMCPTNGAALFMFLYFLIIGTILAGAILCKGMKNDKDRSNVSVRTVD